MSKISDNEEPIVDGAPNAANKPESRKVRGTGKSENNGQIDLRAVLEAPIKLRSDGGPRNVSPFEAVVLQHARKSLVERSIASMKFIIGQAEKHQLIKTAAAADGRHLHDSEGSARSGRAGDLHSARGG